MTRRVLAIIVIALLSACATPRQTPAPVETRDVPVTPAPPPVFGPPLPSETEPDAPVVTRSVPRPPSPASSLITAVDAAMATGELERAAALCERALRITPRDPQLWYRLASIHYQQERFADAAGFARRGLSFAATDPALANQLNALLSRANAALDR
jgi:hypothetical protein